MVAIELAYINTKHPDFHKDAALVSSLLKNAELNQPKQTRRNLANSTSNAILPIENVSKNFVSRFHLILKFRLRLEIFFLIHKLVLKQKFKSCNLLFIIRVLLFFHRKFFFFSSKTPGPTMSAE